MRTLFFTGASFFGLLLVVSIFYSACRANNVDQNAVLCERAAAYASAEEIESHNIMSFEQYAGENGIILTPDQEARLQTGGDLVGEFSEELKRPVKFPNGKIDMNPGLQQELINLDTRFGFDYNAPDTINVDDETWAAWFELRVVNSLVYDDTNPVHQSWKLIYLEKTTINPLIFSIQPDSICQNG